MQSADGMKLLATTVLSLIVAGTFPLAQSKGAVTVPLQMTAVIISGGGVGNPTGTARLQIRLNRLSTTDERAKLVSALKKSESSFLDELKGMNSVGSMQLDTRLPWDLRYARQIPGEKGGSRLILATDRPMGMRELWNNPRYSDYPITIFDFQFDPDGGATGSVILAARVTFDKDDKVVTVENWASEPIPIKQIEVH